MFSFRRKRKYPVNEMRREMVFGKALLCVECRTIIFTGKQYWKTEAGNYCDKCRPDAAVVRVITCDDKQAVRSEGG